MGTTKTQVALYIEKKSKHMGNNSSASNYLQLSIKSQKHILKGMPPVLTMSNTVSINKSV